MSGYKLVSMEPTPEMVEAAEEAYMPFGDMDLALRMAILAAPDEPLREALVMCWIDVKTQLPEISADIDVWHDGMRTPDAFFDGKQFIWIDSGGHDEILRGVTHWRYPPAPPTWKAVSAEAPDVQGEKPRQYPIGPLTHEKVFKAAGLTDLSDMKAVLDAVESALSASATPAVQGEPASRVVPSRDDLIQCLLATHGQSEGITADAILSMLTTAPQPGIPETPTQEQQP